MFLNFLRCDAARAVVGRWANYRRMTIGIHNYIYILYIYIWKNSKIEYTDINYVAVTKGPGSFTGIMVAIACAQAMCFATSAKSP